MDILKLNIPKCQQCTYFVLYMFTKIMSERLKHLFLYDIFAIEVPRQ